MNCSKQLYEAVSQITQNAAWQEKFANHLEELLGAIDPSRIGTEYAAAMERGQYGQALSLLAAYFRGKPDHVSPIPSAVGGYNKAIADRSVEGWAREVNIDWHFENGDIDFLFDPTAIKGPINYEWQWQFNRHNDWTHLARAYVDTRDEKYAVAFARQLIKWIGQTDIPVHWNGPGSAWRTIECGLRLSGPWPVSFDGFKRSPSVSDTTLLLMIASMHRQACHLIAHPTGCNWLMMEMTGVYTFSLLFPELNDSEGFRKTAANYLLTEFKKQMLPDGMQNELSPDYHNVVLSCFTSFVLLARACGRGDEIPEEFYEVLKRGFDVSIAITTPAFNQPRTNDCYTIPTSWIADKGLKIFGDRPEYLYVTEKRAKGAPICENCSLFLPYAGFAVMRSDWGADALYLCFDVGPLGNAHVHQDKLNINIFKGSQELIFDDGGGQYEISAARNYAVSAYGHNTVLVDGLGQNRTEPKVAAAPIDVSWTSNDTLDYASAVYDDEFGDARTKPAVHKREVTFFKPDFFCVTDTLTSSDGNEHDYEVLFHLDTTKVKPVSEYKNAVISDFGKQYDVVLVPLDCECKEPVLKTVSARTEPSLRGWYNGRNESCLHEAITVSREVKGACDYKFTTLIFPVASGQALPVVKKRDGSAVEVVFNGKTYRFDLNKPNA